MYATEWQAWVGDEFQLIPELTVAEPGAFEAWYQEQYQEYDDQQDASQAWEGSTTGGQAEEGYSASNDQEEPAAVPREQASVPPLPVFLSAPVVLKVAFKKP